MKLCQHLPGKLVNNCWLLVQTTGFERNLYTHGQHFQFDFSEAEEIWEMVYNGHVNFLIYFDALSSNIQHDCEGKSFFVWAHCVLSVVLSQLHDGLEIYALLKDLITVVIL
jgi:hypothetical protein